MRNMMWDTDVVDWFDVPVCANSKYATASYSDDGNTAVITIPLPGYPKSGIEVSYDRDSNCLEMQAKRTCSGGKNREEHFKFYTGKFCKEPVITSSYSDGELTITVKKKDRDLKKIEIE